MTTSQGGLGDDLFGTPMATARSPASDGAMAASAPNELDEIQVESERQPLPQQEKQFRVANRVRSKLHNLPDPTRPPLGYVPGKGFDAVFPFIKLPDLAPNLNGDWVQFGSPELEPNRLYYGDNLQVLRTLPSNSIDLIYIDPPFFSGADYNVIWGDTNEVRTFSDIWEGGLDTYLIWLNARLWELRRVLKSTGSIYVHCDWHASHYIKAEMDRTLGYENFRNEIIWQRTSAHNDAKRFGSVHDVILCYGKSMVGVRWNKQYRERDDAALKTHDLAKGSDGRLYRLGDMSAAGSGPPKRFGERVLVPPKGTHWRFSQENIDTLLGEGRIVFTRNGTPRFKRYLDDIQGLAVQDVWTDIGPVNSGAGEALGYPTQKPEELLKRIIRASSVEGDVVADFFCGGGVTAAVAQQLGRRWLACDSSRVAVSVTLNRLVPLGEEQSGVMSNFGTRGAVQAKLDMPDVKATIPDIRVHYVGVYPMDRFSAVEQRVFEDFVLKCLSAQQDASDNTITGWRSAREPLLVGPANPDANLDSKAVQSFFDACVKQLQPNVKLLARVVCWRTSPELLAYRKRLMDYVRRNIEPRGASMELDFLLIDSEAFRERIRAKYPEADEGEFLLRFTKEPIVGELRATRIGARKYRFEAVDADSTNTGGYLVNCQWDFDYQRGHFAAESGYVLGREELKGPAAKAAGHKYEAKLDAEYQFANAGATTIACRVQDNLGAETIRTLSIEVS
jgi:DNA modification methylase